MRRYRLTPAARRDLASIWDISKEHWGEDQAEIHLADIRAAFERITEDPRRGRECEEVRVGYRRYGVGSHIVFFNERTDSVDVIRILHQRMDPTLHL